MTIALAGIGVAPATAAGEPQRPDGQVVPVAAVGQRRRQRLGQLRPQLQRWEPPQRPGRWRQRRLQEGRVSGRRRRPGRDL